MNSEEQKQSLDQLLQQSCGTSLGALNLNFLCQSIGTLAFSEPICVTAETPLPDVMRKLQQNKVGCVLVCESSGMLSGIFSERDFVLKAYENYTQEALVGEFMTPNPVAETPDCTIAFALNLMSQGGFRHLPIVDPERSPIGILSIKDVVDHIVKSYLEDALDIELEK